LSRKATCRSKAAAARRGTCRLDIVEANVAFISAKFFTSFPPAAAPTFEQLAAIRTAETIGLPLGAPRFLDRLETKLGRPLRPGKRGRPARAGADKPDRLNPGSIKSVNSKVSP